jgi:hypothetical protein
MASALKSSARAAGAVRTTVARSQDDGLVEEEGEAERSLVAADWVPPAALHPARRLTTQSVTNLTARDCHNFALRPAENRSNVTPE